jgi:hypothetical protein
MLKHGSGAKIAQLGLDEGAQVTRSAVFDAEYGVQIIVVLDDHAGTHLGGRDRHRLKQSPQNKCGFAGLTEGGQATFSAAQGPKKLFYTQVAGKGTFPKLHSS